MRPLVAPSVSVLNLGIGDFAATARAGGARAIHLDWRPPAADGESAWALARLFGDDSDKDAVGSRIDRANREAMSRLLDAQPVLVDVARRASEVWPDLGRTILHAGPPIEWGRMCRPMRGAIIGAILYEGWAGTPKAAGKLATSGEIAFAPGHHRGAVGVMAGVVSPSMPLFVVRNAARGNIAYAPIADGGGRSLQFGVYETEVGDRLKLIQRFVGPGLKRALHTLEGGLPLKPIIAQALHMGDELHGRTTAATSLVFRAFTRPLLDAGLDRRTVVAILRHIQSTPGFFLNLAMAAAKAALDAAHGVADSSLVTAIARNGVETGIRVSGLGERWFTAPAEMPSGVIVPPYTAVDANPDLGDSAIVEAAGLGAFALGAGLGLVTAVGGTAEAALDLTRDLDSVTLARNPAFTLPALDFVGAPTGIDVRKVVDNGVRPAIVTAIAHRQAGLGQIGMGLARAPMACFVGAVAALARALGAAS